MRRRGPTARLLRRPFIVLATAVAALALTVAAPPAAHAQDPCADLEVTSFSVAPTTPVQGQPATVSIVVRNTGTCVAQGFVVQWRTDPFGASGPSTPVVDLLPNTSRTLTFDFTFPTAGNFETVAVVDTANTTEETNESNNLAILPITVTPATVDLDVTGLTFDPERPVRGRVSTATVTIANLGNTAATGFTVSWQPWPFEQPIVQQVNTLAAGATTSLTLDYTFPLEGAWASTVTVDSTGAVAESDESNNTLTETVDVDPPLADLRITALVVTPSSPVPGQPVTVAITVTNEGNTPATQFRLQWQPWFFGPVLSTQVNSLAVGASVTRSFSYTFPFPASFSGTAIVDSTFQVSELDEFDNAQSTQIVVAPNTVDLVIQNVVVTPGSPTQGSPATVAITVRNQGNTAAGPFLVEWNPDAFYVITPGAQTVSRQVNSLGAGATTTVTFSFSYPLAGNFSSVALVDAFNSVSETNEANNRFVRAVTVQPAPIDLVVTNFVVTPASPVRGVAATANITVRNNGPFPAGPFFVEWRLREADTFFNPTSFVDGLNPGEAETVSLQGTYFEAGTFTSVATVDVFDSVVEPGAGEGNNTATRSVTVVPQQSTLRVTLDSLRSFADGDGGLAGTGEWDTILVAVLDPTATCNVFGESLPSVRCFVFGDNDVDDNSAVDLPANRSIDVTLQELTPLVAAVAVIEDDGVLGVPVPQFLGFASLFAFPPDYLTLGTQTLDGQEGDCASAPRCFQARLRVDVLNTNVPNALAAAAATSGPRAGEDGSLTTRLTEALATLERALDAR